MIEEFKGYLVIDKNSLDHEITQHPELLFKVSEAYAQAVAERDRFKEALAIVDAALDAEIRADLEGEKVTEAIVKNKVQVHEGHAKSLDEYLNAKYTADVLGALRDSFSTRGHMLR